MKATARRSNGRSGPEVEIGGLRFAAGERSRQGPGNEAPAPEELLAASLASCATVTMERYAERNGWEVGEVVVEVDYEPAERGSPTRCGVVIRLPESLPEEQRVRLMQAAAKCPVHRTLEGEVMFEELLELGEPQAALAHESGRRRRSTWTWWARRARRSDREAPRAR